MDDLIRSGSHESDVVLGRFSDSRDATVMSGCTVISGHDNFVANISL